MNDPIRNRLPIPPAGTFMPLRSLIKAIRQTDREEHISGYTQEINFGSRHLFFLPSGRAALWLILKSASILKPLKNEVVIPAYTCPAVASAVLRTGLKPVLVDISLRDFGFPEQRLERAIGRRTLAIVVVHLLGFPANLDGVFRSCKQEDIFVIEDAAQGFGISPSESPDRRLGLQADAGFYSFGRGKPLSVLHGGLAVTGSDELSELAVRIHRGLPKPRGVQSLKYAGKLASYLIFSNPYLYWVPRNMPFLHLGETIFEPDFEIAKGMRLPERIIGEMSCFVKQEQEIRRQHSFFYYRTFEDIPLIRKPPAAEYPYLRYPLILNEIRLRDRMLEQLRRHGTGANILYPVPLNELPVLKDILKDRAEYRNAQLLSRSLITLPVHSGVLDPHKKRIANIVRRCVDDKRLQFQRTAEAAQ